ncbi:thioredoxin family protein [Labilibaculum sp. K2S]|uniref:thioredoxin family protein n=1 Tax=Labilibaculum sp. K2S TaxID=3056386 RepID=UPI0025A3BDBB|nr:thioredoxin family protein [Labilibaculum sp. K2S]MDM8160004.1 thioredoxin family protein [Labilibaculum sp. K2S]
MKKIAKISFLLLFFTIFYSSSTMAQNNLEDALQKAKTENKTIFLNFSGSDWCRSCILLKKTILNTDEFKKFAEKNLVILDVDFPRLKKNKLSKEQTALNESLAANYNSKGQFPTVILMNSDAKVIGKTGYKKVSPEEYIEHLQSLIAQ